MGEANPPSTPTPLSAHHPKKQPDYVKHRLGRGTSGFTCCLLLYTPLPHPYPHRLHEPVVLGLRVVVVYGFAVVVGWFGCVCPCWLCLWGWQWLSMRCIVPCQRMVAALQGDCYWAASASPIHEYLSVSCLGFRLLAVGVSCVRWLRPPQ